MVSFDAPDGSRVAFEYPIVAARKLIEHYGSGAEDIDIVAPRSQFHETWAYVESMLKRGKIKVAATRMDILINDKYPTANVWRIHDQGGPTDLLVADNMGMTIVRDVPGFPMLTSWHIGISPGDLARRHVPRIDVADAKERKVA